MHKNYNKCPKINHKSTKKIPKVPDSTKSAEKCQKDPRRLYCISAAIPTR